MTLPRLPGPPPNDYEQNQDHAGTGRQSDPEDVQRAHRPRKAPLPTAEDCIRALNSLTQLLLLGLVTPAQANAMRGNFRDILAHLRHQQTDTHGPRLPLAELRRLVHSSPHLVSLLESLLSAEQIDELLRDPGGKDD